MRRELNWVSGISWNHTVTPIPRAVQTLFPTGQLYLLSTQGETCLHEELGQRDEQSLAASSHSIWSLWWARLGQQAQGSSCHGLPRLAVLWACVAAPCYFSGPPRIMQSCSTTQLQLHLRSMYCCKDQSLSGKKPYSYKYVHKNQAVIWLWVERGLDDKSRSDPCWPVREQATQDSTRSQCQLLNLFWTISCWAKLKKRKILVLVNRNLEKVVSSWQWHSQREAQPQNRMSPRGHVCHGFWTKKGNLGI